MAKKPDFKDIPKKVTKNKDRILRYGLGALAGVFIFLVGVAFGSGKISIGNSSPNSDLPNSLSFSSVNQVYQVLKSNYYESLTKQQLIDGLNEGLAQSTGDPYTEYFNAKDAKKFNEQIHNAFSGIGAELGQDANGNLEVIAPIVGSPAAKAGIKSKDLITEVNGTSTQGMTTDSAVSKIRGPSGTKVSLTIVRDHSQTLHFTITRDKISVPSVNTKTLDGNIGYIQVTSFTDDTSKLALDAAQKFKQQNVKGIVLDLRDDPGGLVDAAVNVTSLWLPQGKLIMQEKRGSTVLDSQYSNSNNPLQGIPTVVLVNDGSASASEITAGALHDNGAAKIVGVKTYGKGVVQQIMNLSGGAELKVTIASWYRPNGQNINKKGITPDKIVKLSDEDIKAKNDTQLKAAEALLSQQ
ncbi:MAG TPA: S41 family peptidase [Candidatus Saccharimonadales bacterium]|nr:S41 family peptidase [Candidatus Saccharimonadales bacterium]